jgi:copper chaperone NosL
MHKDIAVTLFTVFITMLAGCTPQPEAIKVGVDNCSFCKMTISDNKFGAEILTTKGKVYKFDDAHCILSFLQSKLLEPKEIKEMYLTDFAGQHSLIKTNETFLFKSDALKTPMSGNIAAFSNKDSMLKFKEQFNGSAVEWTDLIK